MPSHLYLQRVEIRYSPVLVSGVNPRHKDGGIDKGVVNTDGEPRP